VLTLGIFLSEAIGSDGACICATRFSGRTARFTAFWLLVRVFVLAGASFSRRWRIWASWMSRDQIEARALARHLVGVPDQAPLFDDGSRDAAVPVRLKGIRVESSRRFGDVYLAPALWRGIGLEALCGRLLPTGKERFAWAKPCWWRHGSATSPWTRHDHKFGD
jgi:hypothetical protein